MEPETDPFLIPRDPGEERANEVVREFLIRASPPAAIFRQGGSDGGYALVVPRMRGERLLTVPGVNEADFHFHGNSGTTSARLADFIAGAVQESGADHLKLPLLTNPQASLLAAQLSERLPEWRLSTALSAVCPTAAGVATEPGILRKAILRAEREGLLVEASSTFPAEEIIALHRQRWGNNRGDSFFGMLQALLSGGLAELVTARTRDGRLAAAQLDILGTKTRHCYYVAADIEQASGGGTAVLGIQWRRFLLSSSAVYSFGRGSERYKYQFATSCRELFEIRGFYAPRPLLEEG
ncbi:MAG TPA: GNAT family N-acetyltransferase [Thermoanaerobaculia bacterium]|nr:GNAT family N-acetyltransferase [Thermoanaerobaculia bacterium]